MAYYPGLSVPSTVPAGTPRTQEAARAQRVNQAQFIEERLRNGIPPAGVAGIAAY